MVIKRQTLIYLLIIFLILGSLSLYLIFSQIIPINLPSQDSKPKVLQVEILSPPKIVTSTPITLTVKVTHDGQPVPGAVVDFYVDSFERQVDMILQLMILTDEKGLASYTGFESAADMASYMGYKGELPAGYNVRWYAEANKLGYEEGKREGNFIYQP
ncbi:hypothetical protein [[Eubacterium] cellulosolvens]